ncbi:permease [Enterococcus italicus]|uniref:permease n=1 Tax=Enterococcus italicus TaxID=246144 RepID=UPI0020746EA8|nr:permease [Enterococcus italicus]
MFQSIPNSLSQMSMIFLSVVIEALPFVLVGCLISGLLHEFLSPEVVKKYVPKNRFLAILLGSFMGVFFPSCECGIVPIVNQFVKKDVPIYTAFPFMLTAPIINPIVVFSTFIAFSDSWRFVFLRVGGSIFVSLVVGLWLAYLYKGTPLKEEPHHNEQREKHRHHHEDCTLPNEKKTSVGKKIIQFLEHSLDEFFDTGRYLIIGALIASSLQVYLPTSVMLTLGSTKLLAIGVMLVLAVVMSLCSEADAFIGASLLSLFGVAPVVAFLVFGPMVDIKNLLMMKRYFAGKFIVQLVLVIASLVTIFAWVV